MKTMTMQDLQGMLPRFQNLTDQEQFQRLMEQQQNQLVQAAGQGAKGGNATAMNPLAMAMMLRKKDPYAQNQGNPYLNAQTAMSLYGPSNVYGFGGMGQVPTFTTGMD
jgi:hypothetical protein